MDQQQAEAVNASMQHWAKVVAEVARESYRQGWLDAMREKSTLEANVIGGQPLGHLSAGVPGEVSRAAMIYREAVEDGKRPLQAVMKAMNLSKATASRRVRAAKDAGLIASDGYVPEWVPPGDPVKAQRTP